MSHGLETYCAGGAEPPVGRSLKAHVRSTRRYEVNSTASQELKGSRSMLLKEDRIVHPEKARAWLRAAAGTPGQNTLRCAALLITNQRLRDANTDVPWNDDDLEAFGLTHRMWIAGCKELHRHRLIELTKFKIGGWTMRLRMPACRPPLIDETHYDRWGWD